MADQSIRHCKSHILLQGNLDYLTTSVGSRTTKRAGASIAYRKEFDSLDQLLKRKNQEAQRARLQNAPPPPVSGIEGNE